jgi:hypothetical protein
MGHLKICAGRAKLHPDGPAIPCVLFVRDDTVIQAVNHSGQPLFDGGETWTFERLETDGCFNLQGD